MSKKIGPEVIESILDRLGAGETLLGICAEQGMPSRQTVLRWRHEDPEFKNKYDQCRQDGATYWAEQALTTMAADVPTYTDKDGIKRGDSAAVQHLKNRADTSKWYASVIDRTYSEKKETAITGKDGAPLVPPKDTTEIAREVAFLFASAMPAPTPAPRPALEVLPEPAPAPEEEKKFNEVRRVVLDGKPTSVMFNADGTYRSTSTGEVKDTLEEIADAEWEEEQTRKIDAAAKRAGYPNSYTPGRRRLTGH